MSAHINHSSLSRILRFAAAISIVQTHGKRLSDRIRTFQHARQARHLHLAKLSGAKILEPGHEKIRRTGGRIVDSDQVSEPSSRTTKESFNRETSFAIAVGRLLKAMRWTEIAAAPTMATGVRMRFINSVVGRATSLRGAGFGSSIVGAPISSNESTLPPYILDGSLMSWRTRIESVVKSVLGRAVSLLPSVIAAPNRSLELPQTLNVAVVPAAVCGLVPATLASASFAFARSVTLLNRKNEEVLARLFALIRTGARATLAAPLKDSTGVGVAFPQQQRTERRSEPRLVINSSPTIIVNPKDRTDLKGELLEALRSHREALYEQWSRELQRRQRTEF
jgi:hypothetical protein